ncbi:MULTISPECIES: hypothetical protein [unclassified Kitasatospora]
MQYPLQALHDSPAESIDLFADSYLRAVALPGAESEGRNQTRGEP